MELFTILLLIGLVVCAVSASLAKNLLNTLLIFMAFSLMMSMIWLLLQAPDLAITEAAVGAGVTSLLFFLALRRVNALKGVDRDEE